LIVVTECKDHQNTLLTAKIDVKVGDIDGKCPICETDRIVKEVKD